MNYELLFKTNPIKAKQTRSEFTPKGAYIPTRELLGILKPGTNCKPSRVQTWSTICGGIILQRELAFALLGFPDTPGRVRRPCQTA
jgi:hypothetical protein